MARLLIFAIFVCFVNQSRPFTWNEGTDFYVNYVNEHPHTHPIKCRCPPIAICQCDHYTKSYDVEAPFAAMLIEDIVVKPPKQWPPSTIYEINKDLNTISGTEPLLHHLQLMPRPINKISARFSFSCRDLSRNVNGPHDIRYDDLELWKSNIKEKPEKVYVLIHGWTSFKNDIRMSTVAGKLLARISNLSPVLIVVDWWQASFGTYRQSAVDSVVIGKQLGQLLFALVSNDLIKVETVHLIGMDMGSHIASMACRTYSELAVEPNHKNGGQRLSLNLGRRTGMNPFARHFVGVENQESNGDANFVDIIHTSTPIAKVGGSDLDILNRRFGTSTLEDFNQNVDARSQVDFYPNGGEAVNCKADNYGCGLNQAIDFFIESLREENGREMFQSWSGTYAELEENKIRDRPSGMMGIDANSYGPEGNQFLRFQIPNYPAKELNPDFNTCDTINTQSAKSSWMYKSSHSRPDLTGCGISSTSRIFQGEIPTDNQFPWMVCFLESEVLYTDDYTKSRFPFLPKKLKPRDDLEHYDMSVSDELPVPDADRKVIKPFVRVCVGSLLNERWVVTAGHCFARIKNGIPIYLTFGSTHCYKRNSTAPSDDYVRRVIVEKRAGLNQSIFINPNYVQAKYQKKPFVFPSGDLALIRLPLKLKLGASTGLIPICFQGARDFNYGNCQKIIHAGYGSKGSSYENKLDARLTWMEGHIYNSDVVRDINYATVPHMVEAPNPLVPADYFSYQNFENLGQQGKGRASCSGDSGGPLMNNANGRVTLIGTVLGGKDCTQVKQRPQRRQRFPSLPPGASTGPFTLIHLKYATRLKLHLDWINDIIDTKTENIDPGDKFWQQPGSGALGAPPDWNTLGIEQRAPASPGKGPLFPGIH